MFPHRSRQQPRTRLENSRSATSPAAHMRHRASVTAETQRAPRHSSPGTARARRRVQAAAESLDGRMLLGYARDTASIRSLACDRPVASSRCEPRHLRCTAYRKRRQRFRDTQLAHWPHDHRQEFRQATTSFCSAEDDSCFHYGGQSVDKNTVTAVRVLINGSPIAAVVSRRATPGQSRACDDFRRPPRQGSLAIDGMSRLKQPRPPF